MSSSERILRACCPYSTIDIFKHAAAITAVVAEAKREARK